MVKTMTENPLKLSKSVTKKFCINKKKKSSYDNETKRGNAKAALINLRSLISTSKMTFLFKEDKYYGAATQILKVW